MNLLNTEAGGEGIEDRFIVEPPPEEYFAEPS